jgi:hypothetical protein
MELINILEITTPFGYRRFKLLKGDISKTNIPVELLCVSAFRGGYEPTPGTVMGSLYNNKGILVKDLAKEPLIDLRGSENTFVTKELFESNIKRILCLEMVGTKKSIDDILNSLLITIYHSELKGIKIKNIMMPLIGTGRQGIDKVELLGSLLKKAEYLLKTSIGIEEIFLVAYSDDDAEKLNTTMNILLKRSVNIFQKSQIINNIGSNIDEMINRNLNKYQAGCFSELIEILKMSEVNAFRLAITSRKICEAILNSVLKNRIEGDLSTKISKLKEEGVAPWLINYFHMLRIFGNAYAHETDAQMSEQDIIIAVFGLERVIEFYDKL